MSRVQRRDFEIMVGHFRYLMETIKKNPEHYRLENDWEYDGIIDQCLEYLNNRVNEYDFLSWWVSWEGELLAFELYPLRNGEFSSDYFFHKISPEAMDEYINLQIKRQNFIKELYE